MLSARNKVNFITIIDDYFLQYSKCAKCVYRTPMYLNNHGQECLCEYLVSVISRSGLLIEYYANQGISRLLCTGDFLCHYCEFSHFTEKSSLGKFAYFTVLSMLMPFALTLPFSCCYSTNIFLGSTVCLLRSVKNFVCILSQHFQDAKYKNNLFFFLLSRNHLTNPT